MFNMSLFNQNRNRNNYIDALKGLAILCVIITHSYLPEFGKNNFLFEGIHSFDMPLFILLSGYLTYGHIKSPVSLWVIDKFKRLIIPFISWGVIFKLLFLNSMSIITYIYNIYKNPDFIGLWFLTTLFMCYIIMFLIGNKNIEMKFVVVVFLLYGTEVNVLGIGAQLIWLFPFFGIGYLYSKYNHKISKYSINKVWVGLLCGIIFISLLYYSLYMLDPHNRVINNRAFESIISISAIISISCIVYIVKNYLHTLSWLGTFTLDIYVINIFCLYSIDLGYINIPITGYPHILVEVIIVVCISIILSFIIRQSKILSSLLLGTTT